MKLIHYFERKAKGRLVQELEGLRFLAIVPVVIQHCVERWTRHAYTSDKSSFTDAIINYCLGGSAGVYLFFAISGFILPLPFAVKRMQGKPMGSLKQYFYRRLTRLEPPYILVMLLLAVAAVLMHQMGGWKAFKYFITGITYCSTQVFKDFNRLNPVIWSLEVEIQFYVLAPFFTWFVFGIKNFQKRNLIIIATIVAAIALQEFFNISDGTNTLRYTILGQAQYFLVGILMVNFYLEQKLQPAGQRRMWDVIATVAIFALIGFRWVFGFGKTLLFVFTLTMLFIGAFRSDAFNRFMKRPWIMAIGGMCYSIYLLHLAIAQGAMQLLLKLNPGIHNSLAWFIVYSLFFVCCLVLIVPMFYLFIEKPCMDHTWPTKLKNFLTRSKTRTLPITNAGAPGTAIEK